MSERPAVTVPSLRSRKRRDGAEPIVMVTAYDEPGARIVDAAGVDILLVGDTLAMTVLGHDDTLHVTIDDMCHHVAAVARAKPKCLVVGDMPWMSYHVSKEETVRNAAALIRAGAHAWHAPCRAFTIVELLAALTIIGILAGFSLMGLTQARHIAQNATCANSLRQLGPGIAQETRVEPGWMSPFVVHASPDTSRNEPVDTIHPR